MKIFVYSVVSFPVAIRLDCAGKHSSQGPSNTNGSGEKISKQIITTIESSFPDQRVGPENPDVLLIKDLQQYRCNGFVLSSLLFFTGFVYDLNEPYSSKWFCFLFFTDKWRMRSFHVWVVMSFPLRHTIQAYLWGSFSEEHAVQRQDKCRVCYFCQDRGALSLILTETVSRRKMHIQWNL